ncbi:hypothetical protein [Idiomarina sp. ST10R2A5]|uniref:hypothetical protein n=1 Tax=Idiomarina sp. ST10R2A5 TaxID=3418368 RepID=UPI003EC84E1F
MDISATLAAISTTKEFASLIIGRKVDSAVTEKAIELQGSIITLQTGILEMQAQIQSLTQEKLDLEESLKEAMTWKSEDEKHELVTLAKGVHVIRAKENQSNSQSEVWYCQSCWEKKIKSTFQYVTQDYGGTHYSCSTCKTKIYDHSDTASFGL